MSKEKKMPRQMSEAFITTVFLTLSGGFQDAYTYMGRGNVFANAQTGNIVLMASNLYNGNFHTAARYFAPLLAFASGVYAAEHIRRHYHHRPHFHWRQLVVSLEILFLFFVGFLPEQVNLLANVLVSFVCAMQVQSFRKVNGNAYASTMCIGNLRSGTEHLYAWLHNKKRASLERSMQYFGVIFLFAVGSAFGSFFTHLLGMSAIWCSCGLLFVSLCIMFVGENTGIE